MIWNNSRDCLENRQEVLKNSNSLFLLTFTPNIFLRKNYKYTYKIYPGYPIKNPGYIFDWTTITKFY